LLYEWLNKQLINHSFSAMKKNLFQLLLIGTVSLSSVFIAQAQPVLNNATTLPVGNSVGIVRINNSSIVNQGAAGSNITWDFSTIQAQSSQTASFMVPDATPFAGNFGNANVAISYENNLQMGSAMVRYEFFSSLASGLIKNGIATEQNVVVSYSDPQEAFTFPFTYGTTQTDDFAATFVTAGQTVTESGTISVNGDGYGTLLLPNATINNVLRVRILQTYSDVTATGGEIQFSVETYAWFHPELAYPLLAISTEDVVGSPTSVRSVHYAQFTPSVGISDVYSDFTFQCAPNPAVGLSNINFYVPKTAQVQLSVYNSLGQKMEDLISEKLPMGSHNLPLSVANYAPGMYLVQITIDGLSETRKLIVNNQ
jgi:hypothetical protein